MINLKNILKRNNIKAIKYKKIKNSTIIYTKVKKYVFDNYGPSIKILTYLNNKNFKGYPKVIDLVDNTEIREYVDQINIPEATKMKDLIILVASLHLKTTFYKEIDESEYKKLYEDITNNLEYLKDYYKDLISFIESKVFMSPSEYLLALNITLIFDSIKYSEEKVKEWYEIVSKDKNRMRVCVINNDLSLDHFYKGKNDYILHWNKSRIDMPIFDLYKLYLRNNKDYDFVNLFQVYEKIYPLKSYELLLLYILISMPKKIEFNLSEFDMCNKIQKEVDRLIKSSIIINNYKSLKQAFEKA